MSKTVQIVARLDPESVQAIDRLPGANRTEKLRNLIAQRGIVASLLDEQRAMLAQVQKAVANLPQQQRQIAPENGGLSPADLASVFQALALLAGAVAKPGMASEAANFCATKVREIAAKTRS
jgi:DNA-binding MarR family transcriptional regulator